MTAGPTQFLEMGRWTLAIDGMVSQERRLSWKQFHELPFETVRCDIHCVTKWSKLGTSFGGVSVDVLMEGVDPRGDFAMAHSYGGYTTNLALADVTGGKAWVVTEHDGEPLPRGHGGPAPAARPPPLLLEERQVGWRDSA